MLIKKIGHYDRFEELKSCVLNLADTVMQHNHISLQYDKSTADTSWLNAYGADKTAREFYFDTLQPALIGTEIERLFDSLGFELKRTRIFVIDPNINAAYKPHKDSTTRIHIPIVADELARFYSYEPYEKICEFMPADGSIYHVDTTKVHDFKNLSSLTKRIHIVGCYYGENLWTTTN